MWLIVILWTSICIWIGLGVHVFSQIRRVYERKGIFTTKLLTLWFVMWGFYHLAVILSASLGLWPVPINSTLALITGSLLIVVGLTVLAIGMLEFRTLSRSLGRNTSQLITTGIYRWSRNPQFMGCLFYLLGIALAGRSAFAFVLVIAASAIIYWYTVRLEEPYLERLYGEVYRQYKATTGRWFSIPKPVRASTPRGEAKRRKR